MKDIGNIAGPGPEAIGGLQFKPGEVVYDARTGEKLTVTAGVRGTYQVPFAPSAGS